MMPPIKVPPGYMSVVVFIPLAMDSPFLTFGHAVEVRFSTHQQLIKFCSNLHFAAEVCKVSIATKSTLFMWLGAEADR